MDFVFTLCEKAARRTCPAWPGRPVTAHWGIPDASAVTGNERVRLEAFHAALHAMRTRINLFTSLPLAPRDRMRLQQEVTAIGQTNDRSPQEELLDG